jgi:transketolase
VSNPQTPLAERLKDQSLEQRAVNTIRVLVIDAVQKADSGHPGAPLGLADMAYVLWTRFLRFDPERPDWPNRDRFVLSAGHASMLQYALLHLTGFDLSLDDLHAFRQWGSRTPGHPEVHHTPGVEVTTGPLGQGLSTAVGMAMAERHLAARLNTADFPAVDHHTFVLASDGDLMEGVQAEAASLAGYLGLGKLVVVYDDNHITIDGKTSLAFATEDVARRYEAYGWAVERIDGHDRAVAEAALGRAVADAARPSLILARTHIGLGSPHKQDTSAAHGSPLGVDEVRATKLAYGFPPDRDFFVADDVREHFLEPGRRHHAARETWERDFHAWRERHPDRGDLWDALHRPRLPDAADRPVFTAGDSVATRKASGRALAWLKPRIPALIGGSADLTPSNDTEVKGDVAMSREDPEGRYLHFGVREHAMAATMNGMALHGGLIPYGGTFFVFADYLRPSLRLAALMGTKVIYVFTHDSLMLGEDGPTHQPVAQLASLRAMPGITVIRPSDAAETVTAWELALERSGPVALALTRQGIPVLDHAALGARDDIRRGAYILVPGGEAPELIVFVTGSEVHVAADAAQRLNADGARVRVVAVPSWEIFFEQDAAYREAVLAPAVTRRMAVEAGSPFGWERFTGLDGEIVAMHRFGASAPADVLQVKFGFTADAVAEAMRRQLDRSLPRGSRPASRSPCAPTSISCNASSTRARSARTAPAPAR